MKAENFNKIVEEQVEHIRQVLIKKADEYNLEEDRLGFFKRAGTFAQTTPEKALYGFLLKHLVSLNDMVVSGDKYSKELWLEKITDIENYLILLLGLLEDDNMFKEKPKATKVRLVEGKK